eukprot:s875_g20.t1
MVRRLVMVMAGIKTFLSVAALVTYVVATEEDCGSEEAASCASPQFLQLHRQVNDGTSNPQGASHFWPHARGRMLQHPGTTSEAWTSHSLSWTWSYPEGKFHNLFAGGPVIDEDKHLYQMTVRGLYAFNSSGNQLWHYQPPGLSNNEVTLYGDLVLGTTFDTGNAFAVNRTTGQSVWITNIAEDAGQDCGYPAAYDGVFVVGGEKAHLDPDDGNSQIFGLNANSGEKLWQYRTDMPMWNLLPLFPGDGTTLFMDFTGGIYKLDLHTGKELWKTLHHDSRGSFGDGGAALGPNGMVYTCSNPSTYHGGEGTTGIVRAFYQSNGTEVWSTSTSSPCNNYPAVGTTAGIDGLSVVVTPGSLMLIGQKEQGEILSLDAFTGAKKWSIKVNPLDVPMNMPQGDAAGFRTRLQDGIQPICWPSHWSAPMIDGNGMVLVGRSDGKLYRVFGPDAGYKGVRSPNMTVSEDGLLWEATTLGSAFLHGALAAAPGLFVVSSCDTIYVFQK